jgi:hypothetical protein
MGHGSVGGRSRGDGGKQKDKGGRNRRDGGNFQSETRAVRERQRAPWIGLS